MLFPHLAGLRIERLHSDGRTARITVSGTADKAACPRCESYSARVHSRYERRVADTAVGGQELALQVRVRRFFCENSCCPARTFAEQFPDLAARYARRTCCAVKVLTAVALALGGRAGARLTDRLRLEVSRSTLLRLIRALPVPEPGLIVALGVDDFAFRRGANYGTVLIDMLTHRPVDLLGDRLSDTFAEWLREHPGAEVICRDRAGGYAEGGRLGAPDALQVADRWHLLHNLTDAVDRIVRDHRACLTPEPNTVVSTDENNTDTSGQIVTDNDVDTVVAGRRAGTTRERHAAVHAMRADGLGITAIATALALDRKTIRRYLDADDPEQLIGQSPRRGQRLDAYLDYLTQRWGEGTTNAVILTAELRNRGYRGSERSVRRLVQTWRTAADNPPARPVPICTPREMTRWMMRPAEKLTPEDLVNLRRVLEGCPTLKAVNALVSDFAGMTRQRQGQHLDAWITAAHASELGPLRSFAVGLAKDYDAVRAGLSTPWSSGTVEGHVNRIKTIKRQMYGRANFDLLRRRVLLAQ